MTTQLAGAIKVRLGRECELQRDGAVCDSHCMSASNRCREFGLELTALLPCPVVHFSGLENVGSGIDLFP